MVFSMTHGLPCTPSPPHTHPTPSSVFLCLPLSLFSLHPALFEGELYSALWVVFNAFQMPEEILAWAQRSSDFGPLPHPHPHLLSGAQGHKENKSAGWRHLPAAPEAERRGR